MMARLGKQILTMAASRPRWARLIAVLAFALLPLAEVQADEHVYIVDPLTGVAINGYDAVAYFTEGEAVHGLPEYALNWAGVPWYFSSPANRDAFKTAPQAYAPIFGGFGAMAVARGFLSEGNPRIFAIIGNHLFLFYSTSNREAFLLSPRSAYADGAKNWPVLGQSLVQNK